MVARRRALLRLTHPPKRHGLLRKHGQGARGCLSALPLHCRRQCLFLRRPPVLSRLMARLPILQAAPESASPPDKPAGQTGLQDAVKAPVAPMTAVAAAAGPKVPAPPSPTGSAELPSSPFSSLAGTMPAASTTPPPLQQSDPTAAPAGPSAADILSAGAAAAAAAAAAFEAQQDCASEGAECGYGIRRGDEIVPHGEAAAHMHGAFELHSVQDAPKSACSMHEIACHPAVPQARRSGCARCACWAWCNSRWGRSSAASRGDQPQLHAPALQQLLHGGMAPARVPIAPGACTPPPPLPPPAFPPPGCSSSSSTCRWLRHS